MIQLHAPHSFFFFAWYFKAKRRIAFVSVNSTTQYELSRRPLYFPAIFQRRGNHDPLYTILKTYNQLRLRYEFLPRGTRICIPESRKQVRISLKSLFCCTRYETSKRCIILLHSSRTSMSSNIWEPCCSHLHELFLLSIETHALLYFVKLRAWKKKWHRRPSRAYGAFGNFRHHGNEE